MQKRIGEGVSSNLGRWIKNGRLPRVGRISSAGTVTSMRWWPWMATKSSPVQLEFGLGGHSLARERYEKEEENGELNLVNYSG